MSNKLVGWRKQIDTLDEKILVLLAKRMKISSEIGKFKKEQGISILDKKRWEEILESSLKKGKTIGLSKEFIKNFLYLIHKYSLEIQGKS